ncbi:MAG: PHP domain-containing protein [Acutalibacteraceae bacterium]
MLCDLHVHSTYSDGTLTPKELIALAESRNVSAIALCDHNTVNGLPEFIKEGKNSNVIAVPGIEISTEYKGTSLHILGLFLPKEKFVEISELMSRTKVFKEESNKNLVNNLCKAGYEIDYDEIKIKNNGAYINRAHIAAELVEKGYFSSTKDAFAAVLSPECGYYTEPKRFDSLEIIGFLRSIGAVPVWAHPFFDMNAEEIDSFLPIAKENGLVGMETRYSEYSQKEQQLAESLAEKHGILQSGGSDFHGGNKPDINMGSGKGNLEIPFAFYEKLKK